MGDSFSGKLPTKYSEISINSMATPLPGLKVPSQTMQHNNNVHFYGQLTAAVTINALSPCKKDIRGIPKIFQGVKISNLIEVKFTLEC